MLYYQIRSLMFQCCVSTYIAYTAPPPHTHTDPTKLLMIPIVSDPDSVQVTVTSIYNPISNSLSFTIVITERGHLSGQWTPGAVVVETDLTLNVSSERGTSFKALLLKCWHLRTHSVICVTGVGSSKKLYRRLF